MRGIEREHSNVGKNNFKIEFLVRKRGEGWGFLSLFSPLLPRTAGPKHINGSYKHRNQTVAICKIFSPLLWN